MLGEGELCDYWNYTFTNLVIVLAFADFVDDVKLLADYLASLIKYAIILDRQQKSDRFCLGENFGRDKGVKELNEAGLGVKEAGEVHKSQIAVVGVFVVEAWGEGLRLSCFVADFEGALVRF